MEYLMTLPIEIFWLLCCIENLLKDGCLPRIGMANDKDAKTQIKHSNIECLSHSVLQRDICRWDAWNGGSDTWNKAGFEGLNMYHHIH